jgi:hypothetical protein
MPLCDYLCETIEIAKGTKSTSTARVKPREWREASDPHDDHIAFGIP